MHLLWYASVVIVFLFRLWMQEFRARLKNMMANKCGIVRQFIGNSGNIINLTHASGNSGSSHERYVQYCDLTVRRRRKKIIIIISSEKILRQKWMWCASFGLAKHHIVLCAAHYAVKHICAQYIRLWRYEIIWSCGIFMIKIPIWKRQKNEQFWWHSLVYPAPIEMLIGSRFGNRLSSFYCYLKSMPFDK